MFTGRVPMAQPPGRETSALPVRASSGPRTSTLARIFRTMSYGAVVSAMSAARRVHAPPPWSSASTPRQRSSSAMVPMSINAGTFDRRSGLSVSRHAAISGNAAFLAPLISIVPRSGRPPRIRMLSMSSRHLESGPGAPGTAG
jgi:hypothetical protein